MIRFTNTLTGKLEPFEPLVEGQVGMYTCGPTVYDHAHIGNFRTYTWEDVLRRFLKSQGYAVTQVMNITDVDDKIIRASMERNVTIQEVAAPFIQGFYEDLDALGIERAEHYPRATEHIQEMVRLIKQLKQNGHTYEAGKSLYFRIASFPAYGRLARLDPETLMAGARVESDEYEKEEARDFALWKASKPGEPFWDTELGPGRPGWHIECSAMSVKYLGESFDIHTGGVDNIFPHHENEIAQTEAATGKPFVRYWLHAEHLIVDGEKMSKSKGNFYTLRDLLERGTDPGILRYLLLSVHYRKQLNFTDEALQHAAGAMDRLRNFMRRLDEPQPLPQGSNDAFAQELEAREQAFWEGLSNDLNTSAALGALHTLVTSANTSMDRAELGQDDARAVKAFLARADSVLNVLDQESEELDEEIAGMIRRREEARRGREWALADQLRDAIYEKGYLIEDTREGTRWKKR